MAVDSTSTPSLPSAAPAAVKFTAEAINRLPIARYTGPVHLAASPAQARIALAEISRERVLGFDTETRAAFRKGEHYPPAIVQLAGAEAVWIFRLGALPRLGGLTGIFINSAIIKAGVAVPYDLRELKKIRKFREAGFAELEKLSDRAGIANNGLRGMAAAVLGIRISKSMKCTNWSRFPLTPEQVSYAATDAWACREIYLRLTATVAEIREEEHEKANVAGGPPADRV
ncbi:MAG: 3'-5' exonuclease [Planctomycetota bacterium]